MKTDNELIAEFMGWKIAEGEGGNDGTCGIYTKGQYYNDKIEHMPVNVILEYNSSWDWLMPVVEKINRMEDNGEFEGFDLDIIRSMHDWISCVDIENAFIDAVTIIKWYNEKD